LVKGILFIMAQKSIYGLVGYPLGHSLSPLMHNAAFKALKLDARYDLFSLKEEELDAFFQDLKEEESPIFGLNVTVPYKEKVLKYLDSQAPFAQKVGAVNTIVISEKRKLIGHNTDGPGFLTHLTELGVNPQNKNIFILGAGGAARAVISVLCLIPERPKSIKIYDVDQSKAKQLIADLSQRMDSSLIKIVDGIFDSDMCMTDFLINATPIGLKDSDPVLIDEKFFNKNMFVYDLIYNPFETKLLKQAKEKGAKASNGLGMLYYQGVLAFQHWAGVDLEENIKNQMRQALEGGLKK